MYRPWGKNYEQNSLNTETLKLSIILQDLPKKKNKNFYLYRRSVVISKTAFPSMPSFYTDFNFVSVPCT